MDETKLGSSSTSPDARKRGLGRGLGALLGREAFDEGLVRDLPIHEIRLSPLQPRGEVSNADIAELAASISDRGVLQPIVVRPTENGYEVVAGQRRWRAAIASGLQMVPAVIRHFSDQESLEVALLENLQRQDLRPLEKARAYQRLHEEFGMTQEQIAARLRKSQSGIANAIRLLQLPQEIQASLEEGRISEGHARALLGLPHPQAILDASRAIERRGLSVRQTETLVKRWSIISHGTHRRPLDPNLAALEEELSSRLQTKVSIRARRRRGHIIIEFYSPTDLERVLALLLASIGDQKATPVPSA